MAPDLERLALTPWPIASLASSGIRPLSSALACSCSRCGCCVCRKTAANSAQTLDELHIHYPQHFGSRFGRIDPEQLGFLSGLYTVPELAFGRHDQMLIERIGMSENLHPFAAAGNY